MNRFLMAVIGALLLADVVVSIDGNAKLSAYHADVQEAIYAYRALHVRCVPRPAFERLQGAYFKAVGERNTAEAREALLNRLYNEHNSEEFQRVFNTLADRFLKQSSPK